MEIDNATYYIDGMSKSHRDDTKAICESLDMTLVNFEGGGQKWRSINQRYNVHFSLLTFIKSSMKRFFGLSLVD